MEKNVERIKVMAKNREYFMTTKYKSCPKWDRFFTKWEMRCFGWFYKGLETEASNIIDVDINWDTGKATASRRFYEWITFKRVSPYTGNLFFKLCELLMTLFSWLRRKIIPLLAGLLVVAFIIDASAPHGEGFDKAIQILMGAILGVYCVCSLVAILGTLFRKIFRIEGKLKESLRNNGYSTDLDN